MDDKLLAGIHLKAVLPLMEDLAAFDAAAGAVVSGQSLVLQFEVRNGPAAHLVIRDGRVRHGIGPHPFPSVRLYFKTPELLNRMFAGEDVRPGLRKGFRHLLFLIRKFPKLGERLAYYMEGEGKTAADARTQKFLVDMGLHAMLGGMAAVAADDIGLRAVAEETPAGTLLVNVLPDGPFGTFSKITRPGGYRFESTFNLPVERPNAVMTFSSLAAAKELLDGRLNAVTAIGQGRDIQIRGLLPLIDKAGIFMYRFGKIMGV